MTDLAPHSNAIYATRFHLGVLVLGFAAMLIMTLLGRGKLFDNSAAAMVLAAPPFAALLTAEATRRLGGTALWTWVLSIAVLIAGAFLLVFGFILALGGGE